MSDVILVDTDDVEIGTMEKLEAHQKGLLHRAFSIFIFDKEDKLLLQRRALNKYHSGGLWTNTCCSHPSPGEEIVYAAERRLVEEMGVHTSLQIVSSFMYKAGFENGLTEHEFDHILIGHYDGKVEMNPNEAMDYKWISINDLKENVSKYPNDFTIWFLKIHADVINNYLGE